MLAERLECVENALFLSVVDFNPRPGWLFRRCRTPNIYVFAPHTCVLSPITYVFAPDTYVFADNTYVKAPNTRVFAPDTYIKAPNTYVFALDTHVFAPDTCVLRDVMDMFAGNMGIKTVINVAEWFRHAPYHPNLFPLSQRSA